MMKIRELGDDDKLTAVLAAGLHTRVSPPDVRVLEYCWEWRYVDDVPALTVHRLAWLLHRKLIITKADPTDDVRIETTKLGRDLVLWMRKRAARAPLVLVR
jgi:hypothetical protein